jgi:hypothetical protein
VDRRRGVSTQGLLEAAGFADLAVEIAKILEILGFYALTRSFGN